MQIAIRPKFSWGGSGVAGTVQIQGSDLCSPAGDRLMFLYCMEQLYDLL